jgi:hypothetical protein
MTNPTTIARLAVFGATIKAQQKHKGPVTEDQIREEIPLCSPLRAMAGDVLPMLEHEWLLTRVGDKWVWPHGEQQ